MKVYAISKPEIKANLKTNPTTQPVNDPSVPAGLSMIAFKSGNPRHLAHVISEEPIFGIKGGGVGTVSHDYNYLDKNFDRITKIIPLYNQEIEYKIGEDGKLLQNAVKVRRIPEGLPNSHPFKAYEGLAFFTPEKIDKTVDLAKFLEEKANSVFVLDEVKSSTMSWGLESETKNAMYVAKKTPQLDKALKSNLAEHYDRLKDKLEFVFTFTDGTASMPKAYADGSYSTATGDKIAQSYSHNWSGLPYAKNNKATIELLPALKEKTGTDPRYILCSDSQSMFAIHYAAKQNAKQDPYWMDKFLGGVGHNMNNGYLQEMGARQAIVNLGATPEQIKKIINSQEYINAALNGQEEKFLRETVLKNFHDAQGNLNAFLVPIHYGKKGYLPTLSTVSEGYYKAILENPQLSPSLNKELIELDKLGVFKGITNPLNDPNFSGFVKEGLIPGYRTESKLKLANGKEVTIPAFSVFDKAKGTDLKHIREIKKQNKINFFERLSGKYEGSKFYNAANKTWQKEGSGLSRIVAGLPNKDISVYGKIDQKYIENLKRGKDVKLVVSWGRGDFQKGLDVVMNSFEKFVNNTKNADTVLVLGGPIENEEAKKVLEQAKTLVNKEQFKGRVVFVEGFAPNSAFASAADVALLPSRFAPCELTDLEAKKFFCTPIVPNSEGMAQKNFDPLENALKMDAYKGKHCHYMTEAEAYEAANAEAKKAFDKIKTAVSKEIKSDYKSKIGKEIPEDLFLKELESNAKYGNAIKNLRDSVISDEMAECLERALIKDRNGKIPETILKNQVQNSTKWSENAWLSNLQKSSAELYQEFHFSKSGKNITQEDLIKLDFSNLADSGIKKGETSFGGKIKKFFKSKSGKWTMGIVGTAAIAGAGYKLYCNKKGNSNSPVKTEDKHLSAIV